MFRLLVSTVVLNMQSEVGIGQGSVCTGITPRKIPRKQKPPAWYVKRQGCSGDYRWSVAPRVRTKYWNLRNISRSSQVGGGDFVCDFPGCGKSYTSKGGLSHHKLISHKEPTDRRALTVRYVLGLLSVRCGLLDTQILTMFWPGRLSVLFVRVTGQVSRVSASTLRRITDSRKRIFLQCVSSA